MNRSRVGGAWACCGALTLGLAVRTAWLFASYQAGGSAARHHVESATVAFIVVGVVTAFFGRDRSADTLGERPAIAARAGFQALLWCAASLALYFPALRLGFLSDDYVLAARAMDGQFGLVHAQFFRPVPLVLWSLLLHAGGGALALHTLNLLGHGGVAWLTTRIAAPYVSSRLRVAAGLLVLTLPSHVEAVTWMSGVFDVTATGFALLAVLAARRLDWGSTTRRVTICLLALAAVLCKETAVVTPLLILLDQWALGRLSRRVLGDVSAGITLFVALGVLRFSVAPPVVDEPLSPFLLQRWLFGTVAALAVPWHRDVTTRWFVIPLLGALGVIALVATFFVSRVPTRVFRASTAFVGWMLLGTIPAAAFFFVSPDLEGGR